MIVNKPFSEALLELEDQSIQLAFTSPPYEDMITYRGKDKDDIYYSGSLGYEHIGLYWLDLFEALERPMKDDGVVGIVINDKRKDRVMSVSNYIGMIEVVERGWNLIEHAAWFKLNGIGKNPKAGLQDWWEHIYLFSKTNKYKYYPERIRGKYSKEIRDRYEFGGKMKVRKIGSMSSRARSAGMEEFTGEDHETEIEINKDGKLLPNVLTVAPDTVRRNIHPARFPPKLAEWAITLCTDPDDLVVDPMCGSGTTLMVAKAMRRKFFGSDIGKDFVELATSEVENTAIQDDLFSIEDVFVTEV